MKNKTSFPKSSQVIFVCMLILALGGGLFSQKIKSPSIESVVQSYKKKFETQSSSLSHKILSKNKAEIVSIYHGAGMTAFTSLYPVTDARGNLGSPH